MKFIKTIQNGMFISALVAIALGQPVAGQEEINATGVLQAQWSTDSYIRGVKVNEDSLSGAFELANIAELPVIGSSVYVSGSISNGDVGSNVKDVFVGATTKCMGVSLDTGARYLDTGTIGRELYVGAGLDVFLSPRVYVFHDVTNSDTYVEGEVSYEYETDVVTKVDHEVSVGAGAQVGDVDRSYYTGSYTVSKKVGPGTVFVTGTVVLNVNSEHDNDTGVAVGYTYTF